MRFIINSQLLLKHLNAISGVISNTNNTVPIITCFHFHLEGNTLAIKATDLETTMLCRIELENARVEGIDTVAIPAKLLLDMLKNMDDQPLNFAVDPDSYNIKIASGQGEFNIAGQNADAYPSMPQITETITTTLPASVLVNAINKTSFAASTDEMRPLMAGIYCEMTPEEHHLRGHRRTQAGALPPQRLPFRRGRLLHPSAQTCHDGQEHPQQQQGGIRRQR